MSQEGMDKHWSEMTPAGRIRTIRNEVMVGYFDSAREHWLRRLVGEPGIAEIVRQIECAEEHQRLAVNLLQNMENAAQEAEDEKVEAEEQKKQADELEEEAEELEAEARKLKVKAECKRGVR